MLTISIFTHMLARFGTEILAGYGIGARLEFMLTSIAFAVGIASVPMIGMAIGAERIARARRIAWTAGCGRFVSVGVVATVIAIFPDLWVNIFTRRCRRARRQPAISVDGGADVRLHRAVDLDVFFLARRGQGARAGAGADRAAVFIAVGGWWLSTHDATAANFFALAAASMVVLGVLSAASVVLTRWGPKAGAVAEVRPALSDVAD